MKMFDLTALLAHEMKDLYSAERQILKALPEMARAAQDPDLVRAFEHHLEETRRHVDRLEEAFSSLEYKPHGERCEAMVGLIKEGDSVIEADASPEVKDAALVIAAQKVEHYEIAAYGSARSLALQLGLDDVVALLAETLAEESAADDVLTRLAQESINPKAMTSRD
jgi:ferritin-like metal-binding protein YciE